MIENAPEQFTEKVKPPVDFSLKFKEATAPQTVNTGEILGVANKRPEKYTFGDVFKASFLTENLIGAFINDAENRDFRTTVSDVPDPSFNAIQYAQPEDEQYLPWTVNSKNRSQYDAMLYKIKDETRQRQILEENPGQALLSGFFANGLDPTILMPGGTIYKGAQASWSAAKSALSVGVAAAASAGVQEVGLNYFQETRTLRESVFNTITTGLIGSMIGGVGGMAFGGGLGNLAKSEIAATLDVGLGTPKPWDASRIGVARGLTTQELTPESVGAAKTDLDLIKQSQEFAGGFLSKLFRGGVGYDIPMMQLAKDSFAVSKNIIALTTEHNMLINKNLPVQLKTITGEIIETAGEANSHAVETLIKMDQGRFENALLDYHNTFLEYNGVKPGTPFAPERAALNKQALNRVDFGRAVYNEIINPNPNVNEVNPFVKKAADNLVKRIFDPIKKAFIEEGIFSPDIQVSTAARYFMRVYNRDLIKTAEGNAQFKDVIRPWIVEQNELLKDLMPEIEAIEANIARLEAQEAKLKADRIEVEKTTEQVAAKRNKIFSELAEMRKTQDEKLKAIDEDINQAKIAADEKLESAESQLRESESKLVEQEEKLRQETEEKVNQLKEDIETERLKTEKNINIFEEEIALHESMRKPFVRDSSVSKKIRAIRKEISAVKNEFKEFKKQTDAKEKSLLKKEQSQISDLKAKADYAAKSSQRKIQEVKKIERAKLEQLQQKKAELKKEFDSRFKEKNESFARAEEALKKTEEQIEIAKQDPASAVKELRKQLETIVPKDSPLRNSEGKIRRVLEDHEYETVVENTIDNILGRGEDAMVNPLLTRLTGTKPSPMASRSFLIPDELIADFLLTDPLDVVPMFTNAMVPYLHLVRLSKALEESYPMKTRKPPKEGEQGLGEFESPFTVDDGRLNLRAQLKEELDFRRVQAGNNEKLIHKIEKEWETANKALDDTYEMLLGRYGMGPNVLDGNAAKVSKIISTWNFTRLMGFLGLSALPDLGAIALKQGVFRFLFDGLIPVLSGIKGNNFTKAALQDMGLALNTYKGMMTKGSMGRDGLLTDSGIFSKALNYASTRYGNATLASQWMDFTQFMAGRTSLARTLRAIDKFVSTGRMSAKERKRLNGLGVTEANYKTIHDEWKRIGGKEEGSYWIDFNKWSEDSPELTNALTNFRASIYKEVNSTVLEAGGGIGDIPRFFKTPLGSTMFQFKKYFFQATNRLLLPAIQRGDSEAWQGAAMMITMGALVWYLKGLIRGDEMDLSFENVAVNAIDQSGLPGQYSVYYGVLSSFGLGLAPSRYNNVGQMGNVLGPAAGAAGDIATFINIARDPDRNLTAKNYERLVRLMPLQNWPPIYRASKALGRNVGLALGAEDAG